MSIPFLHRATNGYPLANFLALALISGQLAANQPPDLVLNGLPLLLVMQLDFKFCAANRFGEAFYGIPRFTRFHSNSYSSSSDFVLWDVLRSLFSMSFCILSRSVISSLIFPYRFISLSFLSFRSPSRFSRAATFGSFPLSCTRALTAFFALPNILSSLSCPLKKVSLSLLFRYCSSIVRSPR